LEARVACEETAALRPDLFEAACVAAGAELSPGLVVDPRFEQPALVAHSLARWSAARDDSPATTCLGHSVGEIAALAAAGALSEADAIGLAAVRGRLMGNLAATRRVAALAVVGTTLRQARQLASAHNLTIAHDNAPGDVMLAGPTVLVEVALRTARQLGIRAVPVASAGISAPELRSLRSSWRAALDAADIRTPTLPVFSCVSVQPILDPRSVLVEGVTAPVRFRQALLRLERVGVRRFVAIGPGPFLTTLVRKTLSRAAAETLIVHPATTAPAEAWRRSWRRFEEKSSELREREPL
jgi:[acyl-carrier-protein] S-malonyltransferase